MIKEFDPNRLLPKVFEVATKAPSEVSEQQLSKIRPYLLRDFASKDLYVRQMMLANDQVDRSHERFDVGYLARFAETIPGKSVLEGHDKGTAPVGRFFDSEVTRAENGWQWVAPWFYMPISPGNQLTRDSIDSGVYSYVSIGCRVDWHGLICGVCGQAYYGTTDSTAPTCPHYKGQIYEGKLCTCTFDSTRSDMSRVEAVEGSIVYLGCQYDAAIAKSDEYSEGSRLWKIDLLSHAKSTPPQGEQTQEADMPTIEELRAANPDLAKAMTDLETQVSAAQTEADTLRSLAKTGTALLADLKSEIKRLGGCLRLGEATLDAVTATDDVEKLLALKAEYEKAWGEKAAQAGNGAQESPGEDATPARPHADRAFRV